MKRPCAAVAALALAALFARSLAADVPAPAPTEVRPGVAYVRVSEGIDPAALDAALRSPGAILDLRFLASSEGDAAALRARLAQAPEQGPRSLIVALVNPSTTGPLLGALGELQGSGRLLVAGPAPATPVPLMPGLPLTVDPEADRLAYLAHAAGTPLAALLDPPVDKARFDEARLLQDHGQSAARNGGAPARPSAPIERTRRPDPAAEAPPPAPRDELLLRTVGLFATMEALRRFPPR